MTWFVELTGEESELDVWKRQFPTHSDPSLITPSIPEPNGKIKKPILLQTEKFSECETAQAVRDIALQLVERMRASIAINIPRQKYRYLASQSHYPYTSVAP